MRKKTELSEIDVSLIRALALDLDGTTLLPDTSMGEKTRQCLKNLIARGIQIIICTGRAIESSRPYYSAIGAQGPMVFFNGAEVAQVPENKLIKSDLLSLDVIDFGIDLSRRMNIHFQVFFPPQNGSWENLVVERESPESETYRKHTGIAPLVTDLKAAIAKPDIRGVMKAMFIAAPDVLAQIRPMLTEQFGDRIYITGSHPQFLEIMNAGVNKGEGLKTVMRYSGLKPEQVIAFGDEENDLPMFDAAGFSAAPCSAKEKIREAADFIYGSVAEEGLAAFLNELFGL